MNRIVTVFLPCALGLALLWGAGTLHAPLLEARRVHDLDHAEPLENAPPLVVFSTVALGGFSGIIADILWVRAAQLQMDGQYFELVQLADWITKLQPRFPEGWIYHAWNLSYNVSVMFPRPEDRWRWVRHGIELLRDGGLRYNPAHPTLHRELGWLFQHKLGASMDQAHMFYKLAWALEMERIFDGRGPDYAALAQTPTSRTAVLQVPGMSELLAQLREEGFEPFTYRWPETHRIPVMRNIMRDHEAGSVLLNHIRLRMMVDRYRLIPSRMQEIEAEHGPLDWRLPQAHAIYWAWSGLPHADGFEEQMMSRMIFHSVSEAFQQGGFFYDPDEELFIPGPNPDLLPYAMRALEEALEEFDDDAMRAAHMNFLNNAMIIMYTHHRIDEARNLFDLLHTHYPAEAEDRGFDQYVIELFTDRLDQLGPQGVSAMIDEWLHQSHFWLALGDTDRAAGYDRLARQTWRLYMEPRLHDPDLRERTGLPPISDIRRRALERVRESLTTQTARDRLRNGME